MADKERLYAANQAAQELYTRNLLRSLSPGAKQAREYLADRGLNAEICKRWNLGYAENNMRDRAYLHSLGFTNDELVEAGILANSDNGIRNQFFNRVMFPIQDSNSNYVGFGGRTTISDVEPKYLNTRETPIFHKSNLLYGLNKAKPTIACANHTVVVEGYMDVISMHEAGFTNTVAALGTAFNANHIKTLENTIEARQSLVTFMFDGDSAGQHAAEEACKVASLTDKFGFNCVILPDNLDPDEYIKLHGIEAMREQIAHAKGLISTVLDMKLNALDLERMRDAPGYAISELEELAKFLKPYENKSTIKNYADKVTWYLENSASLMLTTDTFLDCISRIEAPSYPKASSSVMTGELNKVKTTSPNNGRAYEMINHSEVKYG